VRRRSPSRRASAASGRPHLGMPAVTVDSEKRKHSGEFRSVAHRLGRTVRKDARGAHRVLRCP